MKTVEPPMAVFSHGTVTASISSTKTVVAGRATRNRSVYLYTSHRDEPTGEWKQTSHFRPDELPKVARLAMHAFECLTPRDFDGSKTSSVSWPQSSSPEGL